MSLISRIRLQALDEIECDFLNDLDALAATEEELEKAIQEMRNESVSVSIKSNNVVAKFLRGLR